MLTRLDALFQEKGRLTATLIDEAPNLPCSDTYIKRFGSLTNAYQQIEYHTRGQFYYRHNETLLTRTISRLAVDLVAKIEGVGGYADFDRRTDVLTVNGRYRIAMRVSRRRYATGRGLLWTIGRPKNLQCDLIVALRTDQDRRNIIDFLSVPMAGFPKEKIEFADVNRRRIDACRSDSIDALFQLIWRTKNAPSLLPKIPRGRNPLVHGN
jgi:hypothetical protein